MKKVLFSLLLIFGTIALNSQNSFWEEDKGPYGGGSDLITKTSNGKLYAVGDRTHIYRSEDEGLNWELLPILGTTFSGPVSRFIRIGQAGSILLSLYNYTNETTRWYKSVDEGETWISLDSTILDLHETKNGALVAMRKDSLNAAHVWCSVDDGASWTAAPTDLYFSEDIEHFHTVR